MQPTGVYTAIVTGVAALLLVILLGTYLDRYLSLGRHNDSALGDLHYFRDPFTGNCFAEMRVGGPGRGTTMAWVPCSVEVLRAIEDGGVYSVPEMTFGSGLGGEK